MVHIDDPWRNFLPAKQVSDELKRFIAYAESLQTSNNVQLRYHGLSLAEIASLLARVKEQLLVESRFQKEFASELVSPACHGVDLLLRTLSILQQQLYEASQQQGRLSNLLHRNSSNKKRKAGVRVDHLLRTLSILQQQLYEASQQQGRLSNLLHRNSSNKKRKAGDAEADCLEILKLLLKKTNTWKRFMEHVVHVETILISISSPQLDSKCYALEIATLLLDYPDGFLLTFKALTSLAGKKRDDGRLSLLSAQLPLGLNMNKLHLQVLILRFLNKLILTAPTLNHRVIVQCEAEVSGVTIDRVERILHDHSHAPEAELVRQELVAWRQSVLPLQVLESRAFEHQRALPAPATMGRASYGSRTNALQNSYSTDSEATLTRPKGERKRLFGPSPKTRSHRPSPGVDRHRNRRGTPSSLIEPVQNGGPRTGSQYYGTVVRSDTEDNRPTGTLRKHPGRFSDGEIRQRPASTVYFNEQYGTVRPPEQRSMTPEPRFPQLEAPPIDDAYRSRTLGRSANVPEYRRPDSRRLGRYSSSMHQLNEVGRANAESDRYGGPTSREHLVPIRYEGGTGTSRRRRVQSMENLLAAGEEETPPPPRSNVARQIPVERSVQSRPLPVRQLPGEYGMAPLRRSRSDMGDRQKMQGFSYLYPDKPVVEKVSPVPTNESSRDSGWGTEQPTPPAQPLYQTRQARQAQPRPGSHGHVTYIPIRVQGEQDGPTNVEVRSRPPRGSRGYYDDSSARSSLNTATDSAMDGSLGYPQTGGSSSSFEHSPVRQRAHYVRRGGQPRRSGVGEEVEDALRKFDYLNDYSMDERSNYAAFRR